MALDSLAEIHMALPFVFADAKSFLDDDFRLTYKP